MAHLTRRFAVAVLMLTGIAPHVRAQGREDDPFGALHYLHDLRAFPFERVPPQARLRAMAEMEQRWPATRANRRALGLSVPTSSTSWTPLGPAPLTNGALSSSGRVNAIAIDPSDSKTLYIGAAMGGVWKSTNSGTTWTPLTDAQCSLAMGAITIDPVNPKIVYAGTGEENFSGDAIYGCGVLRTTDGGASWTQLGGSIFDTQTGGARIAQIVIDRTSAGSATTTVLVAATTFGLYRSADAGTTWTSVLAGTATDVVADPVTPTIMYAAIGNPSTATANGIYKSTDRGVSWAKLAGGLPTTDVGRTVLALAPSSPSLIYAAIQDSFNGGATDGSLLGIWRSADAGVTWTKTAATNATCGSNNQCWYDLAIAVDPVNPHVVYFGGFDIFRSADSAKTFTDIGLSIHVDQHSVTVDQAAPNVIYAGNDGGVFRSGDNGSTWQSLNTNLMVTQFYAGVSTSPTTATVLIGGTQDNGTLQWNGSNTWPAVIGGDGGYTAIDQETGATFYGETQWTKGSAFTGPRRRDAATGASFFTKNNGITTADRASFIAPLVMDFARPRILYFGTFRLYRTSDKGESWTAISPDLTKGTGNINAIGVAQSDSMTAYVGTDDGLVQYTHDLGATWTIATGLPTAVVSDFAVDIRDARTAYVTYHGFVSGKVFKTTNGGLTWTDITSNLPNIPVLAIVLEPGSRDIDIGTDLGVFTLRNGTTSWVPIVNGLPNVAVYDLVYDAPRSRLIAATHGRGMFSLDVTVTGLRGDISNDGQLGALDAQAILSAVVGLSVPPSSIRFPNGDANCDGDVTAVDALLVLSKVVGLDVSRFCVGTIK